MSSLSRDLSALGPLFQVVETVVGPATQAEIKLCSPNPLRWALWLAINPPLNTNVIISTVPGNVAKGFGLIVASANATQLTQFSWPLLNYRDHGPLVQQAWYGGTVVPISQQWNVIEVLLLTEGAVY